MTAAEIKSEMLEDVAKYHRGYLSGRDLEKRLWERAMTAAADEKREASNPPHADIDLLRAYTTDVLGMP